MVAIYKFYDGFFDFAQDEFYWVFFVIKFAEIVVISPCNLGIAQVSNDPGAIVRL